MPFSCLELAKSPLFHSLVVGSGTTHRSHRSTKPTLGGQACPSNADYATERGKSKLEGRLKVCGTSPACADDAATAQLLWVILGTTINTHCYIQDVQGQIPA